MKILMIGLGSIGQRHVRNIRRLYGNSVEIIAYRVRKLSQTFSDSMQIREGVDLETEHNIKSYSDLDEALASKPDIAFITNITAKHMECALKCAEAGCDIFLEKPVSDSFEGVEKLLQLKDEKGLVIFMGYQNRYHPCIGKLRNYLDEKAVGKLISVEAAFCERLVTMHSYEDYSTTYMARKEMGGGPVLNLQIHDIDLLLWLFGVAKKDSVQISKGKHSDLKIDVEDHAVITYKTVYEDNEITVTTRSDFLCYPPVHTFKIVGTKGRIELDMNKAQIVLYNSDGESSVNEYVDFQRNDMFINELKDFMDAVKERKAPAIPLEDGIEALKLVLNQ